MKPEKQLKGSGSEEVRLYLEELESQNEELKQVHEQLSTTLNLYTTLFNSIPVGALIVNKEGVILKANAFFCKMLCLEWQEVEGAKLVRFITEEDKPEFYSQFETFYHSPADTRLNFSLYCQPGDSRRDVEISGQEMFVDGEFVKRYGKGPFWLMTFIDTTRQNKTYKELQKSEFRYRTLADNSGDVVWIYNLKQNRFLYVSPSVKTMLGYTPVEAIALSFRKLVVADQYTIVLRKLGEALSGYTSQKVVAEPVTIEVQQVRKDGSTVWTETSARLTKNEEGEPEVVGVSRAIEKRKKLESEMLTLIQVVRQSSLGMIITDTDGIIQFTNPALTVITGYEAEEMIGKRADMFKSKNAPDDTAMWKDLSVGKSWQGTFLNQRKDGTEYWEAARIDCVFNKRGELTHFVSVKEDVSKKIEQENELRTMNFKLEIAKAKAKAHELAIKAQEATVAKSVFLANMSHEIRTPLNAILGFSELIDRQTDSGTVIRGYNSRILRSGEHLLALLNNVLELSRIEAGKNELQETEVSIEDVLGDISSMYLVSAQQKNLMLNCTADPGIPDYIIADGHKLRRVLFNLVSNAMKFTQQGRVTVTVSLKTNDKGARYLYFSVKDTGAGIHKSELGGLFKRFAQTSSGIRHNSGSGLGLSLVYEMVRLMGGDVEVKSVIGKGSTFTFYIPYKQGHSIADKRSGHLRIKGISTINQKKYRILVADDSKVNRQLSVEMLTNVGYETVEATDGHEVLELFQTMNPDLILMDLDMPVYSGFEVIKKLKSTEEGRHVKAIALSATFTEEVRESVMQAGFSDYLLKPFKMDRLLEMIGNKLGVSYDYDETSHTTVSDTYTYNLNRLRKRVEEMDPTLKDRMLVALRTGDLEAFERYIGKINKNAKELKLYLYEQVSAFNYEALFHLIDPTLK